MPSDNPYVVSEDSILDPPVSFMARLKHLGPGLILSASIVGSGELMATTIFGATAGFVALWVILLSCLVKVTVQLEFGKHAIHSGESTMASFNKLPGPKFGKASWAVWIWLVLMTTKNLQLGGIIGGVVGIVLHMIGQEGTFALNAGISTAVAVSVSLMIYRGRYQFIERIAVVLIAVFTVFTFASLISTASTEYAFSMADVGSGFTFTLPSAVILAAVGAFGITGVGGDEIMAYNYWLIEKGYAAYSGPRKNTPEWIARAKGWIRVMYLDALLSMVVYTVMTCAFYLLGAAVLHDSKDLMYEKDLIGELSKMYTNTLGPGARYAFLAGAFVVLYSTLFAALAAWTRQFSDAFSQIGWINFMDNKSRGRSIAALAWGLPTFWTILFLSLKQIGLMVIIGGVITSVILLLVVYAAIHFRYKRLPTELKPSRFYDVCLWLSIASIVSAGIVSIWKALQ
ncbi:MAG: Nramp family divalent metal transporter [Verrucomicrobiae bacterium]|nr:Nramp family divalent metal transporter [Verrucomicrobiae bacterium]